jgi:hypothetical protein
LDEAVFHREQRGTSASGSTDLVVDVLHVVPDGLLGDVEANGHLSIRVA